MQFLKLSTSYTKQDKILASLRPNFHALGCNIHNGIHKLIILITHSRNKVILITQRR